MPQLPITIAGPTASGKSALALALAEQLDGEIISVDSMQVYRGMDIGTAKPSAQDQQRVRHHLIDVAGLREGFDAARFVALARAAVDEIQSRGKLPIFCGGTGLYFKAYSGGLGQAPASDPRLRAELETLSDVQLLAELETRDPVTFEKIDRNNRRRLVRAVEVIRQTGQPFSALRSDWSSEPAAPPPWLAFGLRLASAELVQRIHQRVDCMFASGLVDETRALLEHGLAENPTAMQALGYRQTVEHLHGERSLPQTIELVKIRTRQFAKRQLTWFTRQMRLEWLDASLPVDVLAQQIAHKHR